MSIRNRFLACLAAATVLVSGSAVAALNANEVHLALTSLRLALVKMGVANAMMTNPDKPPASNAEARVAPANQLGSREISAILVGQGGVINVYLTPVVGITNGIIQLVPSITTDKDGNRGVQFACFSPNIPDIASVAPGCTYHAPGG